MKQLQNNYTTVEQSKKLLELGVPADSADCIYVKHVMNSDYDLEILKERSYSEEVSEFEGFYDYIPCWSVGRLIEIITICREEIYTRLLFSRVDDHTNIENLIHYISTEIENGHIEFSKLEEQ